ncbi:hypothetical protein BKA07_003107 [Brevibacterium marinum]|uniref:Uncharacterized protein n=1 Tax=Brevibacterium marinum TaxID=418643 RepID=A0A846S9T1_9MICO|nr:hypothetical protein [Brevibacterium marinum]
MDRLVADVLAQALDAVFDAETGVMTATEGRVVVRAEEVHSHRHRIDLLGNCLGTVSVGAEDDATQPEFCVVGQVDGFLEPGRVVVLQNRDDGTEGLLGTDAHLDIDRCR